MARRPTLGRRRVAASPTTQDNFALLGLSAAQRPEYSFLTDIHSVQDAVSHLNGEADNATADVSGTITYCNHVGAVWNLLDKHKGDWTVRIGPSEPVKSSNLIEITVPTGTRGMPPQRRHQSDLVTWDMPATGQPMPEPEMRSGTLLFQYLRQQQRAMFLNYSVQYLGVCNRIFTYPNAPEAVRFVQRETKPQIDTDGKEIPPRLIGKPRKSEGPEYVADCIRIHRAFIVARRSKSEGESLQAAQQALAPRGGTREGVSASERNNRLYLLTAHLLSTTAKLGLKSPFARLFGTPDDLDRWLQMTPYSSLDEAAWDELDAYGSDSAFTSMTFDAARRYYSQPLPPKPADQRVETRPQDTMTDEQVQAANMMAGDDIRHPDAAWCDVPPVILAFGGSGFAAGTVTERSTRTYAHQARATHFGSVAHPNASTTDPNADQYLFAEQTGEPAERGGPRRWHWVMRRRVRRVPANDQSYPTREEAERVANEIAAQYANRNMRIEQEADMYRILVDELIAAATVTA